MVKELLFSGRVSESDEASCIGLLKIAWFPGTSFAKNSRDRDDYRWKPARICNGHQRITAPGQRGGHATDMGQRARFYDQEGNRVRSGRSLSGFSIAKKQGLVLAISSWQVNWFVTHT